MTTPPDEGRSSSEPDPARWASPAPSEPLSSDPVSFYKPEEPFDPYRYGAPEQPVPAEYAPPGYTPPPVTAAPARAPRAASQRAPDAPSPPGYGQPAQQYGNVAPPPYAQQYPQPRTGNGKAIAGLVLGILAIVFCWTSLLDIVLIALAVIFALLGLGDAKRGSGGRGMAIAGLVCAIVGALLAALMTLVYLRIAPCLDSNKYTSGSSQQNACIQDRI